MLVENILKKEENILSAGVACLYPAPWVLRYSLSFLQLTTLAPVTPSPARITDWLGLERAEVRSEREEVLETKQINLALLGGSLCTLYLWTQHS